MIRSDYYEGYIFVNWVWLSWFMRSKSLDLLDPLDFVAFWFKVLWFFRSLDYIT
jgi:hypothetical protein